jgi:uncharacterized protein RhaS with RHS repeats
MVVLNYRARYYDPAAGRFISEDPMRFFQGANFYSYVGNNAVNFVDSSGLQQQTPKSLPIVSDKPTASCLGSRRRSNYEAESVLPKLANRAA